MNDHEFDQMLRDQHEAFMSEIAATSSGPRPVNIPAAKRIPLPRPISRRPTWTLIMRGVSTLAACALLATNSDQPEMALSEPTVIVNGDSAVAAGSSITVTWTAPGGKHAGTEVISYTVTADGLPPRTVTTTQTVFTGLENGETYRFTVTANLRTGSVALPLVARPGMLILKTVHTLVRDSTSIWIELDVNNESGRDIRCVISVNGEAKMTPPCPSGENVFFPVGGLVPGAENVILVEAMIDKEIVDSITTTVRTPPS
jgi:fibronectin type III domain protein